MTLSPTERKIVVALELEKANSIFSQIEVLQNAGFWALQILSVDCPRKNC